jgi:hypothetical protein
MTNFSLIDSKLGLLPQGKRLSYFSPDITLAQRKIFKQHDIINHCSSFEKYLPNTNSSSRDENFFDSVPLAFSKHASASKHDFN